MAEGKRRYTDGVPDDVEIRLRELCLELPDAYEERAWAGTRWMVRKRTFGHVLGVEVDDADPLVVLSFRLSKRASSSACRAPARASFSAASNAFMVGP